ncbi:endo-1,4-beta-xylanase [Pontiella agarivorans]|uniref:endo-1,4-beta-xylanase n=1 Tax=Pontiella agarivorans TaxID=3038953 RepID=A0ABU5MY06_9BACT|nr:endo-1,4-beta-xylanase [Pontiella agarivorans]MDZ8119077.1 endo-1,4-beta-xylanase [Pontiella agarivorans]
MNRNRFNIISATGLMASVLGVEARPGYSRKKLETAGLAELAGMVRPGFLMGAHSDAAYMGSSERDKKYQHILAAEYNMMSVGIYHGRTQRDYREDWRFDTMNPLIKFAQENNLKVYLHPMYGSNGYIPKWLLDGDYSNEEWLEIIEERIKTILTKFKGKIDILDVYNEGFGRDTPGWRERDNLFLRLGYRENKYGKWPVFLEKMLVWSRKYGGKKLKLIYNDNHNTLSGMLQSGECINLYKALKHEGIPIDGIGIQCHTKITEDNTHELSAMPGNRGVLFDPDLFALNLKEMGEAGINVLISECDVHLYGEIDDAKLALQADAYRNILKACIEAPACKSFKTWGFTDLKCWKPMNKGNRTLKYEPCPLIFDHDFHPKPAYFAMKELLIELIEKKRL